MNIHVQILDSGTKHLLKLPVIVIGNFHFSVAILNIRRSITVILMITDFQKLYLWKRWSTLKIFL